MALCISFLTGKIGRRACPKPFLLVEFISTVAILLTLALTLALPLPVSAAIVLNATNPSDCELPDGDIDGDECITQDVAKNNGGPSADCTGKPTCAGDPINVATGSKFENEVDYLSSDTFPVTLSRYYNSSDTQLSTLGVGWRISYSRVIATTNANQVAAIRDDGKGLNFTLTSGVWQPDSDVNAKLVKLVSGWVYTTGLNEVETYNSDGHLLSVANRAGLLQTLSYDAQGRLLSVTNPFGRSLTFAYTGTGTLVSSVTVPNGGVYSYAYDALNNLISVTYPDKTKRQFVYENTSYPHALTGIIDEKGNRFSTDAYDSSGRDISNQLASAVNKTTLDFSSVTYGYVPVTDALGATRTSTFVNVNGTALESALAYNCPNCPSATATATSSTTYDANGNILSKTDFNGNTTTYTYDTTRNLELSRTEAAGTPAARIISTAWHASFRLPTKIVEPNRTTTFSYDAQGNLTNKAITDGSITRSWSMAYNSSGQLLSIDGPRTDVKDITAFAYDSHGNVSTITNALGQVTRITSYNADGQPLSLTDPNGLVTTFQYDARGLLIAKTVGTEQTSYNFDPAQLLSKVTLPNGATYTYNYDLAHRLTRITDAFGSHIDYTLDALGNRLGEKVYDASGNVSRSHSNTFDALSRLAQSIGSTGQTSKIQYDKNSNLVGVTDPLGNVQSKAYDALNRLLQDTDPNGGKTTYSYDDNGNIQKIVDPLGLATQYQRDGLGDLLKLTSPDTGVTQKTYDQAGNVLTSTDARGKVTQFSYDALNRIIAIQRNDGGAISYTYDTETNSIGHLVAMKDDTDLTHWSYDNQGRVIAKAQSYAGEELSKITYTYDTAGNLAQMTYPSGYKMTYSYDKGRLTQVNVNDGPVVTNISYVPFGGITSMKNFNGTSYNRQYDTDGRVSQYTALGTRTVSLNYDAAGRITQYVDSAGVVNQNMGYDTLGRIVSANGFFGNESYTYDADGNRLSHAVNGELGNYAYDSVTNRLLSTTLTNAAANNTLQRSYDASGNTLTIGAQQFTYNDLGRLDSANGVKYLYNRVVPDVKFMNLGYF